VDLARGDDAGISIAQSMATPMRFLTDDRGLKNSSFEQDVGLGPPASRHAVHAHQSVSPMVSVMEL